MSRDYRLFLEDIQMGCDKIQRYTGGLDCESFLEDEKTFDAVLRNLEIIGEATRHIPESVKELYPQVDWYNIAGFRNIVAHEYFGVDFDILWDIIQHHVPALGEQIAFILAQEKA